MNYKKVLTFFTACTVALGLSSCINFPNHSTASLSPNAINNSIYNFSVIDTKANTNRPHVSDSSLERNINDVINSLTPSTNFLQHVSAVVWYGQTLLVGQVQNPALKDKIYQNVSQVYGIGSIYNLIVVNHNFNPKLITDANDATITTAIKSKILITSGLLSSNFKIVTSYGNVYILSSASKEHTAIVAQLARSVNGVKSIGILIRNP